MSEADEGGGRPPGRPRGTETGGRSGGPGAAERETGDGVAAREVDEFMVLVQRHDEGLRRLAYRLLGRREAMEDALQDAYLKAFRGMDAYRGSGEPVAWLYRIVYNTCIDRLRRDKHSLPVAPEDLAETLDASGPVWPASSEFGRDPADTLATRMTLAEALHTLPPDQRAAVLLVDAQGFDQAAAAQILGVPPGTVASRLHYARRSLRRVLSAEPVRQ